VIFHNNHPKDGKLRATNCPRAVQVSSLLHASPYFSAHGGEDHFLLHTINQPMNFFNKKAQCLTFLTRTCRNCSKLSIDTYPQGYVRGKYLPRWHSIPFPANYHYSSAVTSPPWQLKREPPPPAPPSTGTGPPRSKQRSGVSKHLYGPRRRYAVSFVGTTQSSLVKSRRATTEPQTKDIDMHNASTRASTLLCPHAFSV
jgi:hypothetical protein